MNTAEPTRPVRSGGSVDLCVCWRPVDRDRGVDPLVSSRCDGAGTSGCRVLPACECSFLQARRCQGEGGGGARSMGPDGGAPTRPRRTPTRGAAPLDDKGVSPPGGWRTHHLVSELRDGSRPADRPGCPHHLPESAMFRARPGRSLAPSNRHEPNQSSRNLATW